MPVAEPMKLAVPEGEPGADLPAILEPYLWLDLITPVNIYHQPGPPVMTWLEVRGIVKRQGQPVPQPEPPDQETSYIEANAIRASLLGTAQTAIVAAEDAGYLHQEHPRIEVGGEVRRPSPHDPDRPEVLVARVEVRMTLTRPEWRP